MIWLFLICKFPTAIIAEVIIEIQLNRLLFRLGPAVGNSAKISGF